VKSTDYTLAGIQIHTYTNISKQPRISPTVGGDEKYD